MRLIASLAVFAASAIVADAADLKVPVNEFHTHFNKFTPVSDKIDLHASRGECETRVKTVCQYKISSTTGSAISSVITASDTIDGMANEVTVIYTGQTHSDAELGLATYYYVIGILSPESTFAERDNLIASLFKDFGKSGRKDKGAEIGLVKYRLIPGAGREPSLVATPTGN
jgi:hypothetical protein